MTKVKLHAPVAEMHGEFEKNPSPPSPKNSNKRTKNPANPCISGIFFVPLHPNYCTKEK